MMPDNNLKAVIYCRCSTEEESQQNALVQQVKEAREVVRANGWQLVGEYVELKSGTTTKGRDEYQKLYRDLAEKNFDIVVIKSQDRLMRNVKDWYLFLDRMVNQGKRLYLYIEKKFYTSEDSLITGIKAILAEDYSKELSKKINNAHRHRQTEGTNIILTGNAYGFRKTADKRIELIEEEAKVKRAMYRLCAQGCGCRAIANILYEKGYRNRQGKRISETMIRRIIRNPINKGTVVFNKTHYDFETKQTIQQPPDKWIIHENMVPKTVSDELWGQANAEMNRRRVTGNTAGKYPKGSNPGKYNLSGKMKCGYCEETFYRKFRYNSSGQQVVEWCCSRYLYEGRIDLERARRKNPQAPEDALGCDNIHLNEEKLNTVLEDVCKEYYDTRNDKNVIDSAVELLRRALTSAPAGILEKELQEKLSALESRKNLLMEKLLDGVISDSDFKKKRRDIEEKISRIQEKLKENESKKTLEETVEQRITQIKARLQQDIMRSALVDQMLEDISSIIVFPEYLIIRFEPLHIFELNKEQNKIAAMVSKEKHFSIVVDIKDIFDGKAYIREEKEHIIQRMKEKPDITVKQLAKEMDISLSSCLYRVNTLKKEGLIQFEGKGGHGKWVVLADHSS
ncbi:MAG: recombinase family protein [Eubacteriales bacterium]|nr:recombinase family protein [Eubacteriales bacterium]